MGPIDKGLSADWEAKLAEAGLPTEEEMRVEVTLGSIRPKKEALREDEMDKLKLAMKDVLSDFARLPGKLQRDIIDDATNKNKEGWNFKQVSDRVKIMVKKGKELAGMTSADSDRLYRPRPSAEELKLQKEIRRAQEEMTFRDINDLLAWLEEVYRKSQTEKPDEQKKNESLVM
jgi:hypothetical protein